MSQINLDKLPKDVSSGKNGGKKTNLSQVLKIVGAVAMLAYILIPTDLVPDFAPIIGWVDDLAAGVGMVASIVSAVKTGRYNPDTRMEQRAKDIFGDDNF